jgi:parallel beta-helix repeat protein
LAALVVSGAAHAATFTGRVFEDANYGGGAGRSFADSGGAGIQGVRVELYRVTGSTFVQAVTTDLNGLYSLSSGSLTGSFRVRVVNGTVRSARIGGTGCLGTCVPVQTFRMEGAGNAVVAVTNRVGGENPALPDAISNTTSASFTSLTVANTRVPQSFATVTPQNTGSTISAIDFGFNFDTIVNTRDAASCAMSPASSSSFPCQGSLRQFVINSNALGGEGSLAQSGNGQIDGSAAGLPSGFESSIFMIPDGTANPGQHTGYASQMAGGVATITLATALTTISGANTRLDATTQTANVGNDNLGTLGTGGTVGVDGITLPTFPRPEVQISAADTVVTLGGNGSAILGFALRQGYILLSGSGCLARNNLVGMTAAGIAADNNTLTHGITFTGANSTVRNNFVTVNNSGIRTDGGGMGSLITLNEVARPSNHTNTFDGILLVGTVSGIQVVANLARDQRGGGIEVGFGGGASASGILVNNNTVQGNGFDSVGGPTASTEPIGMAAYDYTGSAVVFSRNLVRNNAGPGIMLMRATGTQVTQNVFSSNGGISIDLDHRSIDPNTLGAPQGVTINDNGDADAGPPNRLLNYPVIATSRLVGGELSFAGFARPNSGIELYVAQVDPSGFGEGLTYLGTFVEGSAADLDTTTGAYGPAAINGILQGTDNTNRFAFRVTSPPGLVVGTTLTSTATISGETSEFSGNVVVTSGPSLQVTKLVQTVSDPVNGTSFPKSIPGGVKLYSLTVRNQGSGAVDNNSVSIVDEVPANTRMFVGNLGAPGSGPVAFVNGAPSSALTWTFTALNSVTDDLDFSNDGGATWVYVPVPDANGYDAAVTDIRMRPKGLMPGGVGGPNFELQFHVMVN